MIHRTGITVLVATCLTHPGIALQPDDSKRTPQIVTISPRIGAVDIDPINTTEIRVTFDIPMDQNNYSFTGGGPTFPRPNGQIRWEDANTCVLPVRLEPNHGYQFGINSQSFKGFRSYWHVPVEPVACQFATGGPDAVKRTPDEQRKINITAFDNLCHVLRNKYSYLELRNIDWESHFAKHRANVVTQPDTPSWTRVAASMLEIAHDVHMHLEYNNQTYPTFIRRVDPNISDAGVKQTVRNLTPLNPTVTTGTIDDDIAYLFIRSFAANRHADIIAATGFIDETTAKSIIIDVRANSGGSETLAGKIAARFITQPSVYAKHVFRRGPNPNDFTPIRERSIEPDGKTFTGPVAVLTGPAVMSSCEAFLLMMKQSPNATLVGQPSYGSSANPNPVYLTNDVKILIPSWKALRPDETCFETEGIKPDISVVTRPKDKTDNILNRAIEYLHKKTASDVKP